MKSELELEFLHDQNSAWVGLGLGLVDYDVGLGWSNHAKWIIIIHPNIIIVQIKMIFIFIFSREGHIFISVYFVNKETQWYTKIKSYPPFKYLLYRTSYIQRMQLMYNFRDGITFSQLINSRLLLCSTYDKIYFILY